jgi:ABC-type uncharacterized transport system YnjBCD ATPase subunit
MPAPLREVVYRLRPPLRGAWPGRHRSGSGDGGFEFRAHVPLVDAPDARRLDLLASLREPFGRWLVRQNSQRLAVPVVMVADLSASMAHAPAAGQGAAKAQVLAEMARSLAWSAGKSGDSFGFFGCAERVLPAWTLLPTRQRSAGLLLADRLQAHQPAGVSAQGLAAVAPLLGRRRALVFLVSDFHLPLPLLGDVLAGLAMHDVVPVVLRHPAEAELGPRHGLAPVRDAETGEQRLLWWRPALRRQWQAAWAAQREDLAALFRRHRLRPVMLAQGFDADALTRHFAA